MVVVAIAAPLSLKNAQHNGSQTEQSGSLVAGPTTSANAGPSSPTTTVNPFKSQKGAYNGTGLGLIGALDDSTYEYSLIYQHASGQIRQAVLSGTWQEGGNNGVIVDSTGPTIARNGTPIAVASYPDSRNDSTYHVIFISENGTLCDRLLIASGGGWRDGNLSRSNFEMMNSPGAQISLIWATDWTKGNSNGGIQSGGGLKIYWSGQDGCVHEASLGGNATTWAETWVFGDDIVTDGGFSPWVLNSIDYLWAVKRDGMALTYYWIDYNLDGSNSTSHPRGTWTKGVASTDVVQNLSALSNDGSDLLYYQNTQNNIIGIYTNATSTGGNLWGTQFQIGSEPAISGSRLMSQSTYATSNTGPQIRVYFQPNGSTIVEWIRGVGGGDWSKNDIPVLQ